MKHLIGLLLIYILSLLTSYGQKISLNFPSEANKEYVFLLNKGLNTDTILRGTVPSAGSLILDIPPKYKDYKGIGQLEINGSPFLSFIVNRENFSVQKDENNKKFVFKNSAENEFLYSIIQDRVFIQKDTTLYASGFVDIIRYRQRLEKLAAQGGSMSEIGTARLYALNDLDMECLYTSGVWYDVVDGLTHVLGGQKMFANDMVQILKKIKSQEVFEHLTHNLITITEQYGWEDAFDIIIPYVEKTERIPYPQGKIYTAFVLSKVRKGMKAPDVAGLPKAQHPTQTLLVFYQPDCENCHAQITQLIKAYDQIKKDNIRVVTISGGNNKKIFEEESKTFPWTDKLCDFKGYSGENYLKFGILATPTFFLLDENDIVVKRFAKISDLITSDVVE